MTILPKMIVVGAAKSGTTTIFEELKRNPKIFIPKIKECRFFSGMPRNFKGGEAAIFQNNGPRDINSYLKLFNNCENKFCIDISNDYFYYFNNSITNIKKTYKKFNISEPKILIILRNPIERVFSMYHHSIRLKSDTLTFKNAFEKSKIRIKNNYSWTYDLKGLGLSSEACKEYLNNFKEVKILLYDEFQKGSVLKSIYDFIELEEPTKKTTLTISNKNEYRLPKSMLLNICLSRMNIFLKKFNFLSKDKNSFSYRLLKKFYLFLIKQNKKTSISSLKNEEIEMLSNFYRDDIKALSILLKVDLTHWISY